MKRTVVLALLQILSCGNADVNNRTQLFELSSKKFIKPMLSNYALGATDRNAAVSILENKPLSRKVLKLRHSLTHYPCLLLFVFLSRLSKHSYKNRYSRILKLFIESSPQN